MRLPLIYIRAFENDYRSITSVKWKSYIAMTTILVGSLATTTTFTISSNIDTYVDYMVDQNGGPKVLLQNMDTKNHFTKSDLQKLKGYIYGSRTWV